MNILFITNVFPPTTGGSASDYDIITNELIKKKNINQITVISVFIKSEKVQKISNDKKIRLFRFLVNYKKQNYLILKFIFFIIQNIQCFTLGIYFRLINKYDLIQTHSDMLWVNNRSFIHSGIRFLSQSGKRTILDIRDKLSTPSKNLNYSHYLVNSEFCYSALSKVINVNNISLIYCPFKIISKKTLEKENLYFHEKPYIVFIGNISKSKGICELLDAMRIFAQNEPNSIKLLFCGELNDPLSTLPNNCNYLGPLDYMNAMKLLFGAELLILPSKSESHPRVIIESIIYKVPFLMTRGVSELEQHFPDNMLENIDPKHIADRINDLLKGDSQKLSNSYPIHLHQIDNVINQLYKVYNNLI